MRRLFENAVRSIDIGVEDYEAIARDPTRALSAVRNFYASVLLLAKEVLVRQAPKANESGIIGASYKPVPEGSGGVRYEPRSKRTIDLEATGQRFKDFGLKIDQRALKELSDIRNDIEHHYPQKSPDLVRQAIAKTFLTTAELFRLAGEEPHKLLGESWKTMLKVRAVYEHERNTCCATFDKIEWLSPILEDAPRKCPECRSELVAQDDPENKEQWEVEGRCRSCGEGISAEMLVENAAIAHFEWESYVAMTSGGDPPLQDCPECGRTTYVLSEDENGEDKSGCVWCSYRLNDRCAVCCTELKPENVDNDDNALCACCGHVLAKDD